MKEQQNVIEYRFTPCAELSEIDTNCNNCTHFVRDLAKYKKWEDWNRDLQQKEFEQAVKQAYLMVETCPDEKGKQTLLKYAQRLRFHFDKSVCLIYGGCSLFSKDVSCLANGCMPQNSQCWTSRKAIDSATIDKREETNNA